jgi:DNA-directed RNA polymerase specialized sigma24 family protein
MMESWAGSGATELCLRWTPRATEIAYLLTGDRGLAARIAGRAVLRCSAHWHDRRNPYALEEWFDKTVITQAGRTIQIRAVRRVLGRRGAPAPAPAGLDRPELRIWQELQALRFRQRAALVLGYHAGLTDPEMADALGCSVSGARSIRSRGLESLQRRVGRGIDAASVLAELLPRLAGQLEAETLSDRALVRRVEIARRVGILEAGCIVAGLAVAAYVVGSAIASWGSNGGRGAAEVAEVEEPVSDAGRVDIGAPRWCPEIKGVQELSSAGLEGPVYGAAEPFAIAQARGRGADSARFADPPSNGPSPESWPSLESVRDLEVLYSFPGDVDRGLLDVCGVDVAERTWIIVLRAGDDPESNQLALYLLRRAGSWKVWASHDPALGS